MTRRFLYALAAGLLLLGAGTLLPPHLGRGSDQADPKALARRALTYLQQSRDLADPSFLSRAAAQLSRSLDLDHERNFEAFLGMASLSNARHDFTASVGWAEKAIAVNPYNASPYGLLGDALFELGRYRAADEAYQKMIDIRPDLASYVRASYSYQFRGRTKAAIGALRLALQAAAAKGEDAAWIRHQLGDVYFTLGRLKRAAHQNRLGMRQAPDYVPPRVGLAEVDIARGRLRRATRTMERAAAELPSLEYIITLGDLYAATGKDHKAQHQYDRVLEKTRAYYHHGVRPDVDLILFYADHEVDLENTLEQVRAMYAQRPTAPVADAFAWTLHKLGRNDDAWRVAERALGSRFTDAGYDLHAGIIASSLGRAGSARTHLRAAEGSLLALSPTQAMDLQSALVGL